MGNREGGGGDSRNVNINRYQRSSPQQVQESSSPTHQLTNVRLLYHPHVVGSVSNGQGHIPVALDKRSDLRLLQRRYAAANDSLALEPALQEEL